MNSYYQAITVVEAQEMLLQMSIADYPQMKQDDRRRFHRDIYKKATVHVKPREVSYKELSELISGR